MDDEKRKIPDDSVQFLRGEADIVKGVSELFSEDSGMKEWAAAFTKAADELEELRERNHYLSQRLGGLL